MPRQGQSLEAINMKPGTSLIELLIAIGVISVILIALAAASSQSISAGIFSRTQAVATKQAEEQMERVRAFRDRNGLAALVCSSQCSLDSSITTIFPSTLTMENLTIWFTVADTGSCPSGNKEVIAYAGWTDSKGPHQSKVVSCLSGWRG